MLGLTLLFGPPGSSNFIDMLKNLVVSPIDGPPLMIFLADPLDFHWAASSGNKIMATPSLAPFCGWVVGPW